MTYIRQLIASFGSRKLSPDQIEDFVNTVIRNFLAQRLTQRHLGMSLGRMQQMNKIWSMRNDYINYILVIVYFPSLTIFFHFRKCYFYKNYSSNDDKNLPADFGSHINGIKIDEIFNINTATFGITMALSLCIHNLECHQGQIIKYQHHMLNIVGGTT